MRIKKFSLFVIFVISIYACSKVQICDDSSFVTNNTNHVIMNPKEGIVRIIPIEYIPVSYNDSFLLDIPLKVKVINKVFANFYVSRSRETGYVLFKSKKRINNCLFYNEINSFKDTTIYNTVTVREKELDDNNILYSCFFSKIDTIDLLQEVRHYYDVNHNLSWKSFDGNSHRLASTVHFLYLDELIDSIDFCDSDSKNIAKIMGNSNTALVDKENKEIMSFDNEAVTRELNNYDIVLIADGHSRFEEDLWIKQLVDLNPDFFDFAFLESLTIADMQGKLKIDTLFNERGYSVLYSGFYFSNPYYRDMTQTIMKNNIPVIGYDIRPKMGEKYDRLREKTQAQNILNAYRSGQRIFVMSGGGHSHLYKSKNGYEHMGYILDSLSDVRISQVQVMNDTIYINAKNLKTKKFAYSITEDKSPKNYHIKTEYPIIVTLHKKNEYIESGDIDIPELTCIAFPDKEYAYNVDTGNYVEVRYNFKEEKMSVNELDIQ